MKTKGESAYEFINEQIKANRTIFIACPRKVIKITPITVKKWATAGHKLFDLVNGELWIARGKQFDCIVSKTQSYVKIQAQ